MDRIFEIYKENGDLHHAYLIEGEAGALRGVLLEHLRTCDLPHEGHPDFWAGDFETLGVDESRELKEAQQGSPVAGDRRIFVVTATLVTHEAQNALLKVFEDPAPGAHFFVIVPSAHALLPTLRSRMMRVGGVSVADVETERAEAFLDAPLKERMNIAKKIAEAKDRGKAIAFADELLRALHARTFDAHALRAASTVREYLNDRSPSVKNLFEYLALTL